MSKRYATEYSHQNDLKTFFIKMEVGIKKKKKNSSNYSQQILIETLWKRKKNSETFYKNLIRHLDLLI